MNDGLFFWVLCACLIVAYSNQVYAHSSLSAFITTHRRVSDTALQVAPVAPIPHDQRHVVNGITCREVSLELPKIGTVSVLEATAESQDDLVELAVLLDGETSSKEWNGQSLNKGDPYGAVLWPAAWAVAKYLVTEFDKENSSNAPRLSDLSILELGTGTGLVSIAAALGGAKKVMATDYEDLALEFTRYAASKLNHNVKNLDTAILDMCDYDSPLPPADLVVAADVMCEKKTGTALARRTVEALRRGSRVIIGDSPGRAGRPDFLKVLAELGVPTPKAVDVVGKTCTGPRNDLICGKNSQSVSESPKPLSIVIFDLKPSELIIDEE